MELILANVAKYSQQTAPMSPNTETIPFQNEFVKLAVKNKAETKRVSRNE